MTADELRIFYDQKSHPNDIFRVHEEFLKLDSSERDKFRKLFGRDQVSMEYITAVEMQKNGTWESYVEKWEQNKGITGEKRLRKYMQDRGLVFPN